MNLRKHELKFAMFLSVYWLWCFTFLIIAILRIVDGVGISAVINGIIQLLCLFASATWIEELLNDH